MHLSVNQFFKYLTVFVLFLGIGFRSESAPFQCIDLFRNETDSGVDSSGQPRPPGVSNVALSHILQGEFTSDGKLEAGMHTVDGFFKLFELNKILDVDASSPKTVGEFRELVTIAQSIYPRDHNLRFEYAIVNTHENGVIFVELPQSVLSKRIQEANKLTGLKFPGKFYVKSLFPINWSHDFIVTTIKEIAANADHRERYIRKSMRRIVQGVNIVVRFDDHGQIGSAYPAFEQPKYENKNFASHQKDAIEKFFLRPFAEKIESSKSFWLINDAAAVTEGRQLGFAHSPKVKAFLEQNLGMNVFRNRLFDEKQRLQPNQFKQKSRSFLINFGITAPTASDIDNVQQILLGNTVMFSPSLQQKLNDAARKSLALYYRPSAEETSLTEAFARDAETNWFSIFFTDVSPL